MIRARAIPSGWNRIQRFSPATARRDDVERPPGLLGLPPQGQIGQQAAGRLSQLLVEDRVEPLFEEAPDAHGEAARQLEIGPVELDLRRRPGIGAPVRGDRGRGRPPHPAAERDGLLNGQPADPAADREAPPQPERKR